jgi:hypothetical protein
VSKHTIVIFTILRKKKKGFREKTAEQARRKKESAKKRVKGAPQIWILNRIMKFQLRESW